MDSKNKQEIVKLLANLNLTQGTTIIMVTHDIHVASHTERMLLLCDGKITKEKQGLHSINKKQMCPNCHGSIHVSDTVCPSCRKNSRLDKVTTHGNNPTSQFNNQLSNQENPGFQPPSS